MLYWLICLMLPIMYGMSLSPEICHILIATQSFSKNLTCKKCKAKYHKNCIRLIATEDTVNIDLWYCPYCTQSILPFNHYDDDELFTQAIVECQLDCSFRFHEIDRTIFSPFEINQDLDTFLGETEPDMQYYTEINHIQSTQCDYHVEDTFIKAFAKCELEDNPLSFFHLNVKSIPKHYDDLEIYLKSLQFNFTFLAITETSFDENKEDLYDIPHNMSENRYRKGRKGGASHCI